MPRGPRVEAPELVHHVTARAPARKLLFHDNTDFRGYVALLDEEAWARRWELFTYCLMPNHVHLLVRAPEANLAAGVKRMHETFARRLNERHGDHGHVFGGRFKNKLVLTDAHFIGCLRYIARNPVAAGLTASAERWPWSAHAALTGFRTPLRSIDPDASVAVLGGDPGGARLAYTELVAMDDRRLMRRLAWERDDWLLHAVDDHGIRRSDVAAHLGIGERALRDRLMAARAKRLPSGV